VNLGKTYKEITAMKLGLLLNINFCEMISDVKPFSCGT